jgi:hypothetical protein
MYRITATTSIETAKYRPNLERTLEPPSGGVGETDDILYLQSGRLFVSAAFRNRVVGTFCAMNERGYAE